MKHANSDNTFNFKKSNATAKAEIPERKEDEQIKPDHLEIESPKPNSRLHVSSTTAAKPDTDLSPVPTGQANIEVAQSWQEKLGRESVLIL